MAGTVVGAAGQNSAGARDFLNPNSMMTPGLAGGMTMLVTNAVCQHFPFEPAQVGLALSFLFGLLVLATSAPMWKRLVYYLLNSLIIFCVAAGASGFGASVATGSTPVPRSPHEAPLPAPAPTPDTAPASPSAAVPPGQLEREELEAVIRRLQNQIEGRSDVAGREMAGSATRGVSPAPPAGQDAAPAEAEGTFFKRWL
jgi:hypothetical protein